MQMWMPLSLLQETMDGKGTEIGRSFEELRTIIDRVELQDKLGVCLDTCHIWDGGYDIVHDLDGMLNEFDRIIGLDALVSVINHPQLRNLPFILETPNELAGYAQEIALLKNNVLE